MAIEDVLWVDNSVLMKLENKHNVHIEEVYECFWIMMERLLKKKPKSYDWPIFDVLVYRGDQCG